MRIVYPTDTVSKALIYSLESSIGSPQRVLFTNPGTTRGREFVFPLLSVFAFVSLVTGWYSNNADNWTWFWIAAVCAVIAQSLLLLGIWYLHHEWRRMPGGVDERTPISIRTLRREALAGHDDLAPPVAIELEYQTTFPSIMDGRIYTVRPPQSRLQRGDQILWGMCVGGWIFVFAMQFVTNTYRPIPWQILVFYPLLVIMYLSQFILTIRKTRAIRVEAREDGLHWRKNVLPWNETRGWYLLALNPVNTGQPLANIVYMLIGQRTSLTWLTYPQEIDSRDPGRQLAELVQAHVNLPLRDLTPSAVRLSTEIAHRSAWRRSRLLAIGDPYMGGALMPRLSTAMPVFLLAVVVLLAGILMPYAQQMYFGGQLKQLESTFPQTRDPLAANTLQWIPGAASSSLDYPIPNEESPKMLFTPFGYVFLSGPCCDLSSRVSRPVGNGLAEVTTQQLSQFDLSSVGLLFRANESAHIALAFTVTANGQWHLTQFTLTAGGALTNERELRDDGIFGGIRAIHQGHDATNRLAVLMAGKSFTFYVNGQFVGGYEANNIPSLGQVGVYADGLADSVTFSDLLIVPA